MISDKRLRQIWDKLQAGEPLGFDDGLYLFTTGDLHGLGYMADSYARKLHGDRVYFVVNRHINPTNYCVNRCAFCAFSKTKGREEGYEYTIKEMLEKASEAVAEGAKELHIVSGLHPEWPFEYYLKIVRTLKSAYPNVHIKAYTAVEIEHFSRISGKSVKEVLSLLKEAGLDSMPGGGAEILNDRVRSLLCPEKTSWQRWLEIHRCAHELGIKTNCTMLYGHVETIEERVEHLLKLRELQSETGGFQAFIPLAFHPENTKVKVEPVTGIDSLRTVAASRLIFHNVPHVKAYWVMLGEGLAQIALLFGASDLEGTVYEEKITHAAGATSPQGLSKERLLRLIRAVGKVPVERDALYNVVRVYA